VTSYCTYNAKIMVI